MRAAKSGFTLIEVVVAAVILVILAAITVPQVMDSLDKQRIEDTYGILQEIHYSITNTNQTGFMNVVRTGAAVTNTSTAPGKLTHLTEPIVAASSTNYHNSCGSGTTATWSYNATAVTTWTLGGPFLERAVSFTDGIALPIGQLQNTLIRTANPATTPAYLQLRINNVDPNDAAALDIRIDGVADAANGTIRYTTVSNVSTVNYVIPVPNRC
jgi:prepilin-type N-terminal cleavage/methylation domain-containing protein